MSCVYLALAPFEYVVLICLRYRDSVFYIIQVVVQAIVQDATVHETCSKSSFRVHDQRRRCNVS